VPTGLLPGEQLWGPNHVSSYLFGANDGINYASPNVDSIPSVQNALKDGKLTLLRVWFAPYLGDADLNAKVQTLAASGMHCLAEIDGASDVNWMKHAVSLTSSVCSMYEFTNEPENNHVSLSSYLSEWNSQIPQLRALAPHALFGGPTSLGASPFLQGFMQGTASSGVLPDFISFHEYPCYGATSEADCLNNTTPSAFDWDMHQAVAWEQQYFGHRVPTGISEYNFDPGGSNLGAWAGDNAFMFRWTELALQHFIADGYDFATQFTTLNYSGYGALDMFDDSSYAPKAQYWAMVDMGQKNGSGSTLSIPSF
jgi:hypothetical protein